MRWKYVIKTLVSIIILMIGVFSLSIANENQNLAHASISQSTLVWPVDVTGQVELNPDTSNDKTGDCLFIDYTDTSSTARTVSLCHITINPGVLGQPVRQGDNIASIASSASHLHFNI